jgi:iron-sulfur cluster repair protein YtfE (RIC family)
MVECDLDTSVLDWVIEHPVTASIFEQLGINDCCGGISLEYACAKQELDPQIVLSMLLSCVQANQSNDQKS